MPHLNPSEKCPIHQGSRTCCGRSKEIPRGAVSQPKYRVIGAGVQNTLTDTLNAPQRPGNELKTISYERARRVLHVAGRFRIIAPSNSDTN